MLLTPHPHLTIPHLTKIIFTDEQCDSNCNLISVFLFHKTCLSLPKHLFVLLSLLMDSTLYYNHSITILHFNGFIDLAIGRVPLINATKSLGFLLAQVVLTLAWASGKVLISNPVMPSFIDSLRYCYVCICLSR